MKNILHMFNYNRFIYEQTVQNQSWKGVLLILLFKQIIEAFSNVYNGYNDLTVQICQWIKQQQKQNINATSLELYIYIVISIM